MSAKDIQKIIGGTKMKKIIALLLAVVMLLTLVVPYIGL